MSEAEFRSRLEEVGRDLDQATVRWTAKRHRRRQALALACTALIATGTAITLSTQFGSNGVEPAAAQVFERAARADAGSTKPRAGHYFYTKTLVSMRTRTGAGGQAVVSTQTTELWAGTDGSGVQVAHPEQVNEPAPATGPELGPTAPAGAAPVTTPKRDAARSRVRRYGKGTIGSGELGSFETAFRDSLLRQFGLGARELVRLSSSQADFNARVLAGVKGVAKRLKTGAADHEQIDRQAFFLVAGLLGQWGEPMPSRLRETLFRFAGTLSGIEVDDNFTDDQGRSGIALSAGGARIVLAPKTFRLRATSYTIGNTETTIETLRTALVDRPHQRPAR